MHRKGLPFEFLHFHKYGHEMFIPSWARKGSFFFTDRQSLVDLTLTVIIRPLSNFIPSWFIKGLTPSCILFPFISSNRMIYWGGNPSFFFSFFFSYWLTFFLFHPFMAQEGIIFFFPFMSQEGIKPRDFLLFLIFPHFSIPSWTRNGSSVIHFSSLYPFSIPSWLRKGNPFMAQEGIICDSFFIPLWFRKG